jgi:hypothetical protein
MILSHSSLLPNAKALCCMKLYISSVLRKWQTFDENDPHLVTEIKIHNFPYMLRNLPLLMIRDLMGVSTGNFGISIGWVVSHDFSKVTSSSWSTSYPDGFCAFPQSVKANAGMVASNRQHSPPFKSFPACHLWSSSHLIHFYVTCN